MSENLPRKAKLYFWLFRFNRSDGNCIHGTQLKHNQSFLQQCIDLIHITQPGLCIWSLDLFVLQFSCTRYIELRRLFSITNSQTLTGGYF